MPSNEVWGAMGVLPVGSRITGGRQWPAPIGSSLPCLSTCRSLQLPSEQANDGARWRHMVMPENTLYFGDNLDILRRYIPD